MPPNKVDHTIRWERADFAWLQEAAREMGFGSTGAFVRWVVFGWRRQAGPVQEVDDGGE